MAGAGAGTTEGSQAPLRRNRDFGIFWGAQTLSVAGDSFALIAVPLLVLRATGSVAMMGLLTAASGAASLGAGVFAGVLVDLLDRRRLLISCDLARMALYALVPASWSLGHRVWPLFVLLPLAEAIGMVFQVGYVTVVPSLVAADRITQANGRLFAAAAVAGAVGPLLAGLVSGRFGPSAAIGIDAASFAVSAAGLWVLRLRPRAAGPGDATGWRQLAAGSRFLWRHPALRALTILLSLFILLTYGLNDVLIYHLRHDLGGTAGLVGQVLAAGAAGSTAGALLAPPLRRRWSVGACWTGAVAVCGVTIVGLGASGDGAVIAAQAAGYLGAVSVAGICSMSLRQEVTPDHLLGRVTSAFWTIHYSLGPLGAVGLTWAAQRFGAAVACAAAGVGCLVIGVAALVSPLRRSAPLPSP